MESINPLSYVPPVGSTTSESKDRGQQYTPRQGQVFKATVLESRGQNKFVLDIRGNTISAQAKVPLLIGQSLQLQVITTSPRVELRVLSDSTNLFAGKTITLLGNSIDISTLLHGIKSANPSPFSSLSTTSQQTLESFLNINYSGLAGKQGGEILKQLIDRLGLSLESLLVRGDQKLAKNSLKAALLELSSIFKGAEELSERTDRLLNTIELYQLAQLHLEKENILIFPLPLPFLLKGYLLVDGYGNKQLSDEEAQQFSLHLSLEGLGNLRIELLQTPEGVYIRFVSESQIKLDFIQQYINEFTNNFININLLNISFSKDHVDPAADLLKRLIPDGESLVNTKV